MAGFDYRRDSRGLRETLLSKDMQDAMLKVAATGKTYAESISPVDSGTYKGSFRVERATYRDRAGAAIVNDAAHAAVVESKAGVLSRTGDVLEKM